MSDDDGELGDGSQLDYKQELIRYKQQIANILESFTDAYFEVARDWTVTYWNREAERLLIMPRDQVLGKNLWEVYNDAVSLKFYPEYHRAMVENVSVRFEEYFAPKDIWLEVAAFPSGNGLSVYFKDVTKQKRATELLELERKKYSDLFDLSPLPQWVYNIDNLRFLDVNQAAIAHYGYSREEFMQMTIADIRPANELPSLTGILKRGFLAGRSDTNSVKHQKKNGEIIDVLVEGNSIAFDGKNARMVMVIDRSTEIQSILAMEESIARFDIVSKATSDAIWDLDMLTGKMIWNQGIRGIFGYKETVYDDVWWRSRVHPDDIEELTRNFDTLIQKKESRLSLEYRFKRADGTYSCVLDRSFVIFDKNGKPVRIIGSMQDITERVAHEQEIKEQNEKLKEIAWIQAHKVRGPLSNILGLAQLLKDKDISIAESNEIANQLLISTELLDAVLKEIVDKA